MAKIKLNFEATPFTGQLVTFTAPCDCTEVTDGLVINGNTYTVVDALGNAITGVSAWRGGAKVTVALDIENRRAFLQNGAVTPASIGALPLNNRGTAIPANADLNDYKTPGKYYSYGTAISTTLSNSPSPSEGFELIVDKGYSYADDLTQIAFVGVNRKICTRSYNSNTGVWQPWAGAVSKSGDTMTGRLYHQPTGGSSRGGFYKNITGGVDYGTYLLDAANDNSYYAAIRVRGDLQTFQVGLKPNASTSEKSYELIHTGNKNLITAADVGAPALNSEGRIDGLQACSSISWGTASKTLTADDIGKTVVCYNTSAITITIPAGLPLGAEFEIVRRGAGAVTIAAASGTSIVGVETARTIKNQYGVVCLKKVFSSEDKWLITGDLG